MPDDTLLLGPVGHLTVAPGVQLPETGGGPGQRSRGGPGGTTRSLQGCSATTTPATAESSGGDIFNSRDRPLPEVLLRDLLDGDSYLSGEVPGGVHGTVCTGTQDNSPVHLVLLVLKLKKRDIQAETTAPVLKLAHDTRK